VLSFSKAGAKVLLFFETTKYFGKKMHIWGNFFEKSPYLRAKIQKI
jgi:hypothetical protein